MAVEAGSAAERAGVQVGDVVLAVGKHAALSIEQVSRLLRPQTLNLVLRHHDR